MPGIDLTGYAALLGESLSSRVELLDRLLGDAHYPSLGRSPPSWRPRIS
jgi:hypothetical protein